MSQKGAVLSLQQLPANRGLHLGGPASRPRLHKKARRIDFHVFSGCFKRAAFGVYPGAPPFSSEAQIAFKMGAAKTLSRASAAPPFGYQFRIDDRAKDVFRRGIDVDFGDNGIAVLRDGRSSHIAPQISCAFSCSSTANLRYSFHLEWNGCLTALEE